MISGIKDNPHGKDFKEWYVFSLLLLLTNQIQITEASI